MFTNKNEECKHRFEARYTEVERDMYGMRLTNIMPDDLHRLITLKVYVHDICTKCGKIVKS